MARSVSGSIDTQTTDNFRQGVELTHEKHFVAGVAKIWSGYPGHVVPQTAFGQSRQWDDGEAFAEKMKFDPVDYIEHSTEKRLYEGHGPLQDATMFDGALEVLELRSSSFDGFPQPPRSIKGMLQSGNPTVFGESDVIVDEYPIAFATGSGPFVDSRALIARGLKVSSAAGVSVSDKNNKPIFLPVEAKVPAFSDILEPNVGLLMPASASTQHRAGRDNLSPIDLPGRVSNRSKAMTAGFTFDNTPSGTDSIAFGGMTFSRREDT